MAINFYGLWFGGLQKDVSTRSYIEQKVCMSHMFHMVVILSGLSPTSTCCLSEAEPLSITLLCIHCHSL
jgi:hypothetical protein